MSAVKYLPDSFLHIFYLSLIMFLILEVSPQQVHLEPFNPADTDTECADGSVIDGQNPIVFYGSVDANGVSPRRFRFLKNTTVNSILSPDCTVDVDRDGCPGYLDFACYCKSNSSGSYEVVFNRTADKTFNGGILRLLFSTAAPSDSRMPLIRIAETVTVEVLGDSSGSRIPISEICKESFVSGNTYGFRICGSNLETTEYYIVTDASFETGNVDNNNCSSFSDMILPNTGNITFGYRETAGCQRKGSFNCTLSGPVSDDPCSTGCIIGIVVGCVVVVVVIIVVIVVCVKKKSRGTIPPQKIPNLEHGGGHHHDEDRNTTTNSQNQENGNSHAAVVVIESVTIIISVDASREVLEQKVKDKVPEDKKRTLTKPLEFKYKGTTMGRENWRLKEHFPQYRGDLVLIAIVHLDESHLCEIKEVKEKASSGGTSSGGNNAVRDSRM